MFKEDDASFKDYSAKVFLKDQRVIRAIKKNANPTLINFLQSSFFKEENGKSLINSNIINLTEFDKIQDSSNYDLFLEHEFIDFISYPYEWSFSFLKEAALFHLNLHIKCLENNFNLRDSSAFNVQFKQGNPIFIDISSFEQCSENSLWIGYKQFCEEFLNPLIIQYYNQITFNSIYKGNYYGIEIPFTSKILPLKSYFNIFILVNVHLHARLIMNKKSKSKLPLEKARNISKRNLISLLSSFKHFIFKIENKTSSFWKDYTPEQNYSSIGLKEKEKILTEFINKYNVKRGVDLGCNTGHYSEIAINNGCNFMLGLDNDLGALDIASQRVFEKKINFLPIYYDIANPTPSIGFDLKERKSLDQRLKNFDFAICFALLHHIAISNNIPLLKFLNWLIKFFPKGLVEFIPIDDPMVVNILRNRNDQFQDYKIEFIEKFLKEKSKKFKIDQITNSKRKIITYY
jgi:ribosomal protein L11 methylase PrmA